LIQWLSYCRMSKIQIESEGEEREGINTDKQSCYAVKKHSLPINVYAFT
jgi:hypothetical protein